MRLQILWFVAGLFGLLVLMACYVCPAYGEESLPSGQQIMTEPGAFGPWFHALANHDNSSSSRYVGPKRLRIKWRWEVPGEGDIWDVPITDSEGNVYLTAGGRCYCVSPDGELLWSFQVPGPQYSLGSIDAMIVSNDGRLYLSAQNRLYAFGTDKRLEWTY